MKRYVFKRVGIVFLADGSNLLSNIKLLRSSAKVGVP